ncbi:MAG: hypothetical protein C0196_00885 [Dictyoglomus turgidum]|nr:MAG: hypothetical protein C0196_00885 [Dictyoglomus turgidum]
MKDSPIELLREKVADLRKLISKILVPTQSESKRYAEDFILKRQEIQELVEDIRRLGISIEAELVELSEIDGEVKKNLDSIYKLLKNSDLKSKGNTYPRDYWWWHIWDIVEKKRKRKIKRITIYSLLTVLILIGVVILSNYFKPSSQEIIETMDSSYKYLSEGKVDMAQRVLEEKIEKYNNSPDLWLSLGIVLEHKDVKKAKEAFDKSLKLYKTKKDFLINRAIQYKKLGFYEKAERDLEEVLSMDKDNSQALYILATIFEEKNQIGEAIKIYKRIEELGDKADPQILVMSKMRLITLLQSLNLPSDSK